MHGLTQLLSDWALPERGGSDAPVGFGRRLLRSVVETVLAIPATRWHTPRASSRAPHYTGPAGTRSSRAGRVILVGAGPGDPELLTLKAIRVMQSADVILYDALVTDAVLSLASRDAQRIPVGKRSGRPSCRQDDINRLMVTLARAGKRVVRLKAGDPSIFGRAGEELAHLQAAGVGVDIVPGITAASAMAAAFGISLTHRDHAKSVRFVTGHGRNGGLPDDLDWKAVADPSATTVFYMGGRTAREIARRLVALGMPATTPVGVAACVSQPNERLGRCTLANLASFLGEVGFSEPIVIGVGRLFADASSASDAARSTAQERPSDASLIDANRLEF